MLRRKTWLSLAAAAFAGFAPQASAQDIGFAPVNAPMVQFVDNHEQPDNCRSGIMGGASVYLLRPYFNNNTAFIITTGTNTDTPVETSEDFNWNFHVAPAAWLGWSSKCGIGGRARFFQFDGRSEGVNASLDPITDLLLNGVTIKPPSNLQEVAGRRFGSPGVFLQDPDILGQDVLGATSDLYVQTIDGEATFAHEWCNFGTMFTVGGRFLHMHQGYHATLVNIPFAGFSEETTLDGAHNFHGGGPTVSWEGRWQLGRSGVAVFGTFRGSLLVGKSRETNAFHEVVVNPNAPTPPVTAVEDGTERIVLPIGELEGGLEYSRACGRTRLFVRGAAVNQTYFHAGSPSGRDGNLSLFGAQVSVGLNY